MGYNTTDKLFKAAQSAAGVKNFANLNRYNKKLADRFTNKSSTPSITPAYQAKTKTTVPKDPSGNDGVRAAMTNMGLDNAKIGWKDGYVTYNDMRFKPSNVQEGVSYAPNNDIQSFVNSVYKTEGKNPIRITDYPAPAGLGSISHSDNGMVAVGGENIPVLYNDGGNAVVNKSDVDKAYENLKNSSGIRSAQEVYDSWNKKYANQLGRAYDDLEDYSSWRYNPEADPAYHAYSEMYQREGERAYRDAAAKMASKNYGNMTSAAQNLANQQLGYYMSQLADRIPELQRNDYERYKNGFDMKKQTYDAVMAQAEAAWKKRTETNDTAKTDYGMQLDRERQRTLNAQADLAARLNADAQQIENGTAELKQEGQSLANTQAQLNNAWENAQRRGGFTDTEGMLWQMPQKENGSYVTPNDIKIQNDIQYFNEASVPKLDYESQLAILAKLKELEVKRQNDIDKAAQSYEYNRLLAAYKASLK